MNPYRHEKKSTEKRRLFFDTEKCLVPGDSLASINSITAIDYNGVDVTSTIISGTPTISGNTVIIIVQNGINFQQYTIRIRMNTTGLDIIQDNLILLIKD